MSRELASEKVVISSPMSFSGSAQRIWKITESGNAVWRLAMTALALCLIGFAWFVIFFWYILMYGVFGIFFFIYRLLRRSNRQNKADKLRHRELLDTVAQNKDK